jgi:tyrosine-protein kinase Etk/Wzc
LITETSDPRLSFVAAGRATAAEGQVYAQSEQLAQILAVLARQFDHVILDLPAVLGSKAAVPLARHADVVGLVVRHGVTSEGQARAALERLTHVTVAGVILNRASSSIPGPIRRRLANW